MRPCSTTRKRSSSPEQRPNKIWKGASSALYPALYWKTRLLDETHVRVDMENPVDITTELDKDYFGACWINNISQFLIDSYLEHTHLPKAEAGWKVADIFCAKRISYPEKFEYHLFFKVVEPITKINHSVFAELEIARTSHVSFVVEVHFCNIVDSSDLSGKYDRGCRFCPYWVPHPKNIKTFRPPPSRCEMPRLTYETKDVDQFPPLEERPPRHCCGSSEANLPSFIFDTCLAINNSCHLEFLKLKEKRYRFIIFKIPMDLMEIRIETIGEASQTLENLAESLPADDCRYCVINYEVMAQQSVKNKLVFVEWFRDTANIKSKRTYGNYKKAFMKELYGIEVEIKASSRLDMTYDFFNSKCL